ncbi:serine hydrolase domain-containing protein [Pontimicrobium sp. SW4]|uniref:Serine hydrolase domain-containing protein n=1 Tax=Pontimicrobium sp. SW4 TaxID=3153519 RepID=A0AAU7BPA0_9FLAO
MKTNLSFLIILISFYSCAQTNHLDKIKAVDNLFEKWNNSSSPGAAIGIIQDGEFLYSKGYGLANLEHNIPNSPLTAFSIASNSKQFTAASIVLLSQRGKLDLNQSLSSFYPEFPEYAKTITIKNLLYHTSGLRDYAQITYLSGLRPDDYYNDDDILKWIKNQKQLNFSPGEKHLYCNSGYWLLGRIVEKASGMSLADFAQKEIFEPLGMTNTHFLDNNTMIIKQRASGYSPSRSGDFRNILSTLEHTGDRGIYTTVEDIKKWDDEFYNRKILKDNFWELMTTQGLLNNGDLIDFAFGLQIKKYRGLKTMDHGGRAPGFWSNIIRFPEQKFSVIVFTNTADANATPLGYQIADIFLGDMYKEPKSVKSKREITIKKLPKETLNKYVGSYWNTKDSYSRKITLKNDTLRYERSPRSMNSLVSISKNEFKMLNTPPGAKVFVRFQQENKMVFIENGIEVGVFKTYTPATYNLEELQLFSGNYYSEEINAYYEFKVIKDRIILYINKRETVPLRPIMEGLFSSPMGIFEFKRNGENKVEAFNISTPRVKGLTFTKVK